MQIQAQSKIVISLSKMTELFSKNDNFGAIFSILKHILGLSISNYLTKKSEENSSAYVTYFLSFII